MTEPPTNRQCAISIMAFPLQGDSYVDCFYPPVEALGVKVYEGKFSGRWLIKNLRNIDYVHIHWPSFFYNAPQPRKCLSNFVLFTFFLVLARWRGARIVWTVHNLYPHEPCVIPLLDTLARRLLIKWGTLFLVHGPSAEADVRSEFPAVAGRTAQIEHGHWIGYYPNTMSCMTARSRLGLTENEFVFLLVGSCNPYKNLETLIHAFEQLDGNPALIISGKFKDAAYEAKIRAAIKASSGHIILHSGYIRDEDMQVYLCACNVVAIPYSEILSSGSAILALSFRRPVIAPAMGTLKDLIIQGCGFLYDPSHQPASLRDSMQAAMETNFDEDRIQARALKLDWQESAKIVVARLTELPNRKGVAAHLDPKRKFRLQEEATERRP